VTLHGEPTAPDDRPVSKGKLIRVSGPALPPVRLSAGPVAGASLELAFSMSGGVDEALLGRVVTLIDRLSEFETSLGGPGVTHDPERSKTDGGAVRLVLVPNDPTGATERLTAFGRVAATAVELVVGAPVTVVLHPAA